MKDAAFLQQEERRLAKAQVELEAKRESRAVPEGNPKAMVEFLLNTSAEEMPFEVARCRPHLVRRWVALARRPPSYSSTAGRSLLRAPEGGGAV